MTPDQSGRVSGGVPSTVRWGDGTELRDENGFVTALACRETRRAGANVSSAWLDILETCRRPDAAYGFWPVGRTPAWAPDLPGDSDDTAVMLLELTLAGRVARDDARRVAYRTLADRRLGEPPRPGPGWLRRGMFTTWHHPGRRPGRPGIVDLTVVANALAALFALDLAHAPGVSESLAGLRAAADWAGDSRRHWSSTTPFYAEPDELARALDHAGEWGVPGAAELAATVRTACPRESPDAVCSMAYGPPTWHSPDLAALRDRTSSARAGIAR